MEYRAWPPCRQTVFELGHSIFYDCERRCQGTCSDGSANDAELKLGLIKVIGQRWEVGGVSGEGERDEVGRVVENWTRVGR